MPSPDSLDALLDTQAIRDVLSRYCRGLDRMDRPMAESVWHEGGTADYVGIYEGTGHGFIEWVWKAHAAMEREHEIAREQAVRQLGARKSRQSSRHRHRG